MSTPDTIADAVIAALGAEEGIPEPARVEAVMRPFFPITYETEQRVRSLLSKRGHYKVGLNIGPWMEANDVVSGTGPEVERRIDFLMRDTCTCVLDHLHAAIAHATKEVDPRVLSLLGHKHFKKT